jgi:hypothetical protein
MTINTTLTGADRAKARGYTKRMFADGGAYSLDVLVMPGADLDDEVRAWDLDECEWLDINGWLFTWEEA